MGGAQRASVVVPHNGGGSPMLVRARGSDERGAAWPLGPAGDAAVHARVMKPSRQGFGGVQALGLSRQPESKTEPANQPLAFVWRPTQTPKAPSFDG